MQWSEILIHTVSVLALTLQAAVKSLYTFRQASLVYECWLIKQKKKNFNIFDNI